MGRLLKGAGPGLLTGAALAFVVLALFLTNAFEGLELKSYDLRFVIRGSRPPPSPGVILAGLDPETTERLSARAKDFPRPLITRAVKNLSASGARVIVLDILLVEPSRDPRQDDEMASVFQEAGNVVLARFISTETTVTPLRKFQEVEKGEGMINITVDRDGVMRSLPVLSLDLSGEEPIPYLSLSLEAVRVSLFPDEDPEVDLSRPGLLMINTLEVVAPDNKLWINYYGPPGTLPFLPLWRAVTGDFPKDMVEGKAVLIGGTHPSLFDFYPIPFSRKVTESLREVGEEATAVGVSKMFGVEIYANALQTVLDGAYIRRSPALFTALLILVLSAAGTALFILGPGGLVRTLVWATILVTGLCAAAMALFATLNYWLDLVPLVTAVVFQTAGGIAYHQYREALRRREVTALFGKYVSPQVVHRLITQPGLVRLGGSKERLTIFFSDIRGFTSMSEKMDPSEVTTLLNEYFSEMSALVFTHNGTLNKFMGDAIMAFFGNPIPYPDHALRAVQMSLAMQEAMTRLNATWAGEGRKTIGIGIGVNTGFVTVGNLGSDDFFDYTVIGDEVNLACRIEENAKAGQVLITRSTYEEVKEAVEVIPLPPLTVKGKTNPIEVYQVVRMK